MRITIGNILLGEYTGTSDDEDIPIGGFSASGTGETQRGNGTCTGMARLKDRGGYLANFTIPTTRTFDTVSEAQKWIADTPGQGYSGILLFVFEDGSETTYNWAIARPTTLEHRGVMVRATWSVEAGEKLS